MAFIIGLVLLYHLEDIRWSNKFNWEAAYDLAIRAALIISTFLIYICMLFTQSRGGLLGLFVGISLFYTLVDRRVTLSKWKEILILFILIFLTTFITSLNPLYSPFGRFAVEAEKTVEMSQRETPIVGYNATLSRLETWKSGYKIIVDRPLFGIGQEVLKMVFPRYETEKFRFYEGFHVKQDRCHNEVCDMAVTRGVITLAIYIWLIATFYYLGIKIVRGDYDPEFKLFAAGFLGGAATYLIQNQFSFGVVAMTTLFWILIGMTTTIYVKPQPSEPSKSIDLSNMPWLLFAATLIVAFYFVYLSTIQFRADMHFKDGKNLADMRRFDQAIKEYEVSLKISPYEGGTWTHYGIATLNLAQSSQNREMLDKAINIFNIANKVDPYNADNFYITGRAYYILSFSDPAYLEKVKQAENNALKIDPLYAEAYQIIGSIFERMGKYKEAAEMYKKTVEINPQLGDAMASLSGVYVRMGKANQVIEIYKEFLNKYPNNPIFEENLAAIYVQKGDISAAIKIYEDMVQTNPQNVRALVNLGFMSARMRNLAKAKDSFERAIMIDPKSVDAHNGLGLYYMQSGQNQRAKDEFNQSLMVDPNNQYAKQMLEKIK
jgi:tetratricopeptide (TPR) repeat protein